MTRYELYLGRFSGEACLICGHEGGAMLPIPQTYPQLFVHDECRVERDPFDEHPDTIDVTPMTKRERPIQLTLDGREVPWPSPNPRLPCPCCGRSIIVRGGVFNRHFDADGVERCIASKVEPHRAQWLAGRHAS